MKSALRILVAVLMFVSCALAVVVGLAAAKEGLFNEEAQQIEKQMADVEQMVGKSGALAKQFEDQLAKVEEARSALRNFGYGGIATMVFALAVVVLAFVKRIKILLPVVGVGLLVMVTFVVSLPREVVGHDVVIVQACAGLYVITAVMATAFAFLSQKPAAPAETAAA